METEQFIESEMAPAETPEILSTTITSEEKTNKRKKTFNFKEKKCRVISYNKKMGILDISFDGYGIRLRNVFENAIGDSVTIKYKGEIGNPNFSCKL